MKWNYLVALALALLVLSSCAQPSPTPTPLLTPAIPIRGVVNAPFYSWALNPKLTEQLKDMGVNWIELVLWVLVTEDGKLIPYWESLPGPPNSPPYSTAEVERVTREAQKTEEVMIRRIRNAHENGFKVFLCTYHERMGAHHYHGKGLKVDVDSVLGQAKEIALNWARICEENHVEMYAPRKELQLLVGDRKALEWDNDILPELRKLYHGDLVRGAFELYDWDRNGKFAMSAEDLPADMSGWDYLGVDLYGNGVDTFEEWAAYVERFASKVRQLKAKHGLKGAVFEELSYPHGGGETFWQDKTMSGQDILEHLYQITFEGCFGAIEGFFLWSEWTEEVKRLPAGRQEHISLTKLLKNYYTAPAIPKSYEVAPAKEMIPPEVTIGVTRTLLKEDFEGAAPRQLFGRNFSIADGVLRLQQGSLDTGDIYLTDFVFRGKFQIKSGIATIGLRVSDACYAVTIQPISSLNLSKSIKQDDSWHLVAFREANASVAYDKWYTFTIIAKDGVLQVFIDGEKVVDYEDPAPLPKGAIIINTEDGDILLDDLVVEEIIE